MHNLLKTAIGSVGSGTCFSEGLVQLLEYHSKISSVREAVYNNAEKITPEIIEQANQLVSSISQTDIYTSFAFLSMSVFLGAYTIGDALKKDKEKDN